MIGIGIPISHINMPLPMITSSSMCLCERSVDSHRETQIKYERSNKFSKRVKLPRDAFCVRPARWLVTLLTCGSSRVHVKEFRWQTHFSRLFHNSVFRPAHASRYGARVKRKRPKTSQTFVILGTPGLYDGFALHSVYKQSWASSCSNAEGSIRATHNAIWFAEG
jgi:hypothetical protein